MCHILPTLDRLGIYIPKRSSVPRLNKKIYLFIKPSTLTGQKRIWKKISFTFITFLFPSFWYQIYSMDQMTERWGFCKCLPPDVTVLGEFWDLDNLWSHPGIGACRAHSGCLADFSCQTKVCDFERLIRQIVLLNFFF